MDRIILELGIKEEVVRENFRREKVSRPTELLLTEHGDSWPSWGDRRWGKKAYQHSASKYCRSVHESKESVR